MAYKFNVFTGTLDIVNASSSGVTGIPPTTIDAIARWADTTGTTIKNSPGTYVQDGGALQTQGFIGDRSITTLVHVPSEYYMIAAELEIELTGAIEIEPDGELIIL
jgi:hypothetical protein